MLRTEFFLAILVTSLLLNGWQIDTSKQGKILESAGSDALEVLDSAAKANARIDKLEARVDALETAR